MGRGGKGKVKGRGVARNLFLGSIKVFGGYKTVE